MSVSTLMVHLDLDQPNAARLAVAGALARRLGAHALGVAACDVQPSAYFYSTYGDEVLSQDRLRIEGRLKELEAEFRAALEATAKGLGWRAAVTPPAPFVARETRAADLVITGPRGDRGLANPARELDPGDLVMRAGRPLLVVPPHAAPPLLAAAVVAWKDCREARRAVADAVPLLRLCGRTVVAAVEEEGQAAGGAAEVAAFLGRHGIAAEAETRPADGSVAAAIDRIAEDCGADLVVAGAYGHSRFSEWVLGGVTRDLLARPPRCVLLAH